MQFISRNKYLFFVIILSEILLFQTQAQVNTDSLLHLLGTADDKEKATLMVKLAEGFISKDLQKSETYAMQGVQLSKKNNQAKETASGFYYLGQVLRKKGKLDSGLIYHRQSLDIRKSINADKKDISNSYYNIASLYFDMGDFKKSIPYYDSSIAIKNEINDRKGLGICYLGMGNTFFRLSNYERALYYLQKGITSFESVEFKPGIINCLNLNGLIYEAMNKNDKAIENYEKALELSEKVDFSNGIIDANISLGNNWLMKENTEKALEYFNKALAKSIESGNQSKTASALTSVGLVYERKRNYDKALDYYQKSQSISNEIGDMYNQANTLISIGNVSFAKKDFFESREAYKKGLHLSLQTNQMALISVFYKELSKVDSAMGNFQQSLENYKLYTLYKDSIYDEKAARAISELQTKYETEKKEQEIKTQKAEINAKDAQNKRQQIIIYSITGGIIIIIFFSIFLFRLYKKIKFANVLLAKQKNELHIQKTEIEKQANELEKANIELEKLSIVASETDNAVIIADKDGKIEWINKGFTKIYGYTLEEYLTMEGNTLIAVSSNPRIEETIERIISTHESAFYDSLTRTKSGGEIWTQTTVTPIFDNKGNIFKLVAIDSDITSIKKAEEEIRHQKEVIEVKNRHITDSIRYAQRIQKAILLSQTEVKQLINDSFLLYLPKDIVSGDFYWIAEKNNRIYFSAVDCTGHGVPGAFMSILGSNILNQALLETELNTPSEILNYLSKQIQQTLRKSTEEHSVKDGMDLALCAINKDNHKLEYAAVHNSIFLVRKGEVMVLKPDTHPIGEPLTCDFTGYTHHELPLEHGDTIYVLSDGFIDQFGGPKRKKYLSKQFQQKLIEINELPMEEQKNILYNEFVQWRGNIEQYDDVLIFGVRI